MKLSFDLELEDWDLYLRVAWLGTRDYRRQRLKRWIFYSIALIFLSCSAALLGSDEFYFIGALLPGTITVCYMVFGMKLYDYRAMKAAMRQVQGSGNRNLFGRREMEFTPDGVRSVTRMGEMFYKADAIQKVEVTPGLLLLYLAAMTAIVIPRLKLTQEEFDAAVAYAREHYTRGEMAGAAGDKTS